MSEFYDDFDEIARELLNEFDGRQVPLKLIRTTGSSVSSVTGEDIAGTTSEIPLTGIVAPYKIGQVNLTTIQAGDLRAILDSQVEPLFSDSVIIDGFSYAIVGLERVRPADVTILYKLQLRR